MNIPEYNGEIGGRNAVIYANWRRAGALFGAERGTL
jgi:hypothetical protein